MLVSGLSIAPAFAATGQNWGNSLLSSISKLAACSNHFPANDPDNGVKCGKSGLNRLRKNSIWAGYLEVL
jgi:hypothetical protein